MWQGGETTAMVILALEGALLKTVLSRWFGGRKSYIFDLVPILISATSLVAATASAATTVSLMTTSCRKRRHHSLMAAPLSWCGPKGPPPPPRSFFGNVLRDRRHHVRLCRCWRLCISTLMRTRVPPPPRCVCLAPRPFRTVATTCVCVVATAAPLSRYRSGRPSTSPYFSGREFISSENISPCSGRTGGIFLSEHFWEASSSEDVTSPLAPVGREASSYRSTYGRRLPPKMLHLPLLR